MMKPEHYKIIYLWVKIRTCTFAPISAGLFLILFHNNFSVTRKLNGCQFDRKHCHLGLRHKNLWQTFQTCEIAYS